MTSMTVYDFDTGPDGSYEEELTVPGFAYYKTPLRPVSDNEIASTVGVNLDSRSFTSTATGSASDRPTNPTALSDEQAQKGVQFFFVASNGYVDGTFAVRQRPGTTECTGSTLLFAGDAALCAPPPPLPPSPPPSSPPSPPP